MMFDRRELVDLVISILISSIRSSRADAIVKIRFLGLSQLTDERVELQCFGVDWR